jgi:hypothetical protein
MMPFIKNVTIDSLACDCSPGRIEPLRMLQLAAGKGGEKAHSDRKTPLAQSPKPEVFGTKSDKHGME